MPDVRPSQVCWKSEFGRFLQSRRRLHFVRRLLLMLMKTVDGMKYCLGWVDCISSEGEVPVAVCTVPNGEVVLVMYMLRSNFLLK